MRLISKPTIIAGLLIIGFADNLTDLVSIHIYQESEKLEQHSALRSTLGNFVTRLVISLSFAILVLGFSSWNTVVFMSVVWGVSTHSIAYLINGKAHFNLHSLGIAVDAA